MQLADSLTASSVHLRGKLASCRRVCVWCTWNATPTECSGKAGLELVGLRMKRTTNNSKQKTKRKQDHKTKRKKKTKQRTHDASHHLQPQEDLEPGKKFFSSHNWGDPENTSDNSSSIQMCLLTGLPLRSSSSLSVAYIPKRRRVASAVLGTLILAGSTVNGPSHSWFVTP